MREERLKVLEMLAAGRITVEEANALLEVLEGGSSAGEDRSEEGPQGAFPHFDFASFFEDSFGKYFNSVFGKDRSKTGAAG
jgi:hypothetical protein